MMQSMSVLTSQATCEWYTPSHVVGWIRDILGSIELDPASCVTANRIVRASRFYTVEDNGYRQPWTARTLFLNPPFSDTPKWLRKLEVEYESGRTQEAVMLVNSAPGYVWYEAMWRKYVVCCLRERLRFVSEDFTFDGQAKKAQTLIYFGQDATRFTYVLAPNGRILHPDR